MTPLQKHRLSYQPVLPKILKDLCAVTFRGQGNTTCIANEKEIGVLFPKSYGRPLLTPAKGESPQVKPLKVGVVLSGGQAAGGHNVITGLFDALHKLGPCKPSRDLNPISFYRKSDPSPCYRVDPTFFFSIVF